MNRRVKAIIKKEFIHIWRDPRSLGVAILLPVVLLLLYGYGINLDVRHLKTAVLDQDNTNQSRTLLSSFEHSGYFDFVSRPDSYSHVEEQLDYGKAKVVIIIPKGFANNLAHGKADMQIVVDGSDSTTASLAISYGSQVVQKFNKDVIMQEIQRRGMASSASSGLDVRTRYWYNAELNSTNFIAPGLIAIILMMLSSLLTSMTIVREREKGTIEQLVVSPIKSHELVLSKLVPYIIIAFFDVIIVILASVYIFSVPLVGNVFMLLAASILFLFSALGLGMLISSVSNTQLVAMAIAVIVTMLPTVLLSGFMYPVSTMPAPIRMITYLIPAKYYLVIVRGIFLKGIGPAELWPHALLLLATGVFLIVMSARKFKKVL